MFKKLNPILHSELRLAIVSFLVTNGTSDFIEIKEMTKATAGNISIQLKKLQAESYIVVTKGFKENYQHTAIEITEVGINAFEEYVHALKAYIK